MAAGAQGAGEGMADGFSPAVAQVPDVVVGGCGEPAGRDMAEGGGEEVGGGETGGSVKGSTGYPTRGAASSKGAPFSFVNLGVGTDDRVEIIRH